MSKIISVNPPKNLTAEDEYLFSPFLQYELDSLKIKKLRNVFVTHTGFCLDKNGLVKESHHRYPEQYSDYLIEAAYYYNNASENPDNLIELDDQNNYLLIHHPWFNYYHWICEAIFRIWMVRDRLDEMTLLLPEHYQHSDFIMGSLEPFRFKNIFFIPSSKSLFVRNLCMPQIKPVVNAYKQDEVFEVRKFYLHYALSVKKIDTNLGERIYISRKKASRKKIANEEELESILHKYHFTIINNEDYCFQEQIAIYAHAKYLISIHGSGLTNMLFMQEKGRVLEFHKKKTNEKDWHSLAFWYLAACLEFDYYHQVCEPTDPEADYFNANFIVDPELFEKNINQLIFD
ncbi:MAG: glycosyltransferase family 61 protein [Bacteroidetes bacterium]|nr:glycosyltransferase family 61 protein [Bacteroidota bacterium]